MTSPIFSRLVTVLSLAVPLVSAGAVRAVVDPATVAVTYAERTSLSVTWIVAGAPPGAVVTSEQGRFVLFRAGQCGTTPLSTIARPLSGTSDAAGTLRARERFAVPAAVTIAARKSGASALCYLRTFSVGNVPLATEELRLTISGGLAADFAVTAVRLRFDDGSIGRIVTAGTDLGVVAEIAYRGEGRLRAFWELAGPATTLGRASFRRIGTVHRRLTGSGRMRLAGPRLPTATPGLHLLRLRFVEPDIDTPELVIRYFVRRALPEERPPAPLALRAPQEGARLRADLSFAWEPLQGAAAYRVEFFPSGVQEGAHPHTGLLVPGEVREAALTPPVRERLAASAAWRWRVVAFDAEGRIIAVSDLRLLRAERDAAQEKPAGEGPAAAGAGAAP